MALRFLNKYIFNVRPILRPWLFLVFVFYVPVFLFTPFTKLYSFIFPSVKSYYKMILACQGQLLGLNLFHILTSITIIIFLLFKKSLNEQDVLKPSFKQYFLGILFALFVNLNQIIFGWHELQGREPFEFLKGISFYTYILLFLIAIEHCFITGILEEIIFRGVMQGYFKEIKGPIYSIFATSFAFLIPHIYNIITFNTDFHYIAFIFFLSVLLCSVREKYNNLSFCFAAHIFSNLFLAIINIVFNINHLTIEIDF